MVMAAKATGQMKALGRELKERVLPFGWFERSASDAVRFVTDHAGSVPLYYAQYKGRVLAGKAPLEVAVQMAGREFDPVSVADFLLNGTVCYPYSLFKGVYAAPPGAITDVTPSSVRSEVFYLPTEQESEASVEAWGRSLRERVREALLVGLENKKSIKVLFSGGEDSRAVVSLLPMDMHCELVTFADGYNREARLAKRAARALGRSFTFVRRPEGFYRRDIRGRSRMIGGVSDIRHTHVYGVLADSLRDADAIIGGFTSDSLVKSMLIGNVNRSFRRFGPERILKLSSDKPVGVDMGETASWLIPELVSEVQKRRWDHHRKLADFRPDSAGNWHWLWPLGCHHEQYAHYLATQHVGRSVLEPFLCPQVYSLAACMPDHFKVDRKAFRAAFAQSMRKAGWLPTSSGRIPRLGGYVGHWIELGTIVSRRLRDRVADATAHMRGIKPMHQGAWSADDGAFRQDFEQQLSANQLERLRLVMDETLTDVEAKAFFRPDGGVVPNLVRDRALQLGHLVDD